MTAAREAVEERAPRSAWFALAVLTLINLFNYLDRFVAPAALEQIKNSKFHFTDSQASMVLVSFCFVYTLTSPIFGAFGKSGRRTKLIAMGVGVWSIATALTGFATSYSQLLGVRSMVGIGEAAYGVLAPAMLADLFPPRIRGRILAVFYAALPVGSALGFVLGGYLTKHYSWQTAFLVAGPPGLLLAVLALFLRDVPPTAQAPGLEGFRDYAVLIRNTSYLIVVAGFVAQNFGLGGISAWMSVFIQRAHHVDEEAAGLVLGKIVVAAGFMGSLLGGWLGDRLRVRWRESYMWVCGISTILAVPFAWLAVTIQGDNYQYALFVACFLLFISTGPVNTTILGIVAPAMRAAAMAMSTFAIHACGDCWSPLLVGKLSDQSDITLAVRIIPVAIALGGIIWTYAAWRGERSPARGAST